jgi:uncharacterized protein DUF3551
MMRPFLTAAAFIAALSFSPVPAQAGYYDDGPWCANVSVGHGVIAKDCHYRSAEECSPNVIAGNRGFCTQNPRWAGWNSPVEPVRHSGKRRHHRG